MSTPDHEEFARLMLTKARADLSAARLLASDTDQDDGVIGFHAQQARRRVWLNPWAVTMRYDEQESPLDRDAALAAAESVVVRASAQVPPA